jgi:hypothetical protein
MTKDEVKRILDRVLTWLAERQADVAHMVELMDGRAGSHARPPSDDQVAEVERRVADRSPKFLTLEEVPARFAQRRA